MASTPGEKTEPFLNTTSAYSSHVDTAIEPVVVSNITSAKTFTRHRIAYGLSQLALGSVFGAFVTYVGFQIQIIGYAIGHVPDAAPGSGCPPDALACRVPFANGGDVNLTSAITYLQAISYAVSGALTVVFAGIGDRLNYQREQYVILLAAYGALALPLAALKGFDSETYSTLSALYVVFNIVGFLAGAWAKILIPFVMHGVEDEQAENEQDVDPGHTISKHAQREVAGLSMSLWGSNALNLGQLLLFIVVIGLSYTSSVYAGLYITTGAGALCVIGALASWSWLPAPQHKTFESNPTIWTWLAMPFVTVKDLFLSVRRYPEAAKCLFAYTMYVDSVFAFDSIRSQLFNLEIRPDVRQFTAYSLVGPAASMLAATVFVPLFPAIERRLRLSLRHWMAIGFVLNIVCTVWCCVGISDSADFGLKYRWEFYVVSVLRYAADAMITIVFTVLYAQLFPEDREIEYFGFQLIVSCGTVWVPQVVNGPIVDATNIIRLPAVISTVFLLVSLGVVLAVDEVKGMKDVQQYDRDGRRHDFVAQSDM